MGAVLCEHCTAACCRYLAIPLDKPRSARDYDDIRWYLMHEQVSVFVEDGDWYIQFATRCKNLAADNQCGVYERRPRICREYKAHECDYTGGTYGYDHFFTHAKQVEQFYTQRTGKELALPTARAEGTPRRSTKKQGVAKRIAKSRTPA